MRLLRRLITTSLLLLLLLTAFGYWQWRLLLNELGINDVHFQLAGISWQRVDLDNLNFHYKTSQAEYELALEQLSFNWFWHGLTPQLAKVNLQQLKIELSQEALSTEPATPFRLPAQWQLPDWLPEHLDIVELQASLPCATNRCPVAGSLSASKHSNQQWQLVLSLSPTRQPDPNRQLRLTADYRLREQFPQLVLDLEVTPFLSLYAETALVPQKDYNWQGHLALEVSPPPDWVLAALAAWGITYETAQLQAFTKPAFVKTDWKLSLAEDSQLTSDWLSNAKAQLNMQINLPSAVTVPKLGLVEGNSTLALITDQGRVDHYQATADLTIKAPELPKDLIKMGLSVTSAQIKLTATSDSGLDLAALPLHLQLLTSGDTQLQLQSDLLIKARAPYELTIIKGELSAHSPSLALADMTAKRLSIQATFNGLWQDQLLNLSLLSPTTLTALLDSPRFSAEQCKLTWDQLTLSGNPENWRQLLISGDVRLDLKQLTADQLLTQNWQWQSTLKGRPDDLIFDALLTNSAGLKLKHQINYHQDLLDINWQLEDIFFLASNPIRQTLKNWPELLDVERGKITAKGNLHYSLPQSTFRIDSQIQLKDINAIYDRSLLQGVSAQIRVQTLASQFIADVEGRIEQLNQGLVFGPFNSQAQYQATFDDPLRGRLELDQLNIALLGGHVTLAPQTFDLTKPEQVLPFLMTDIELAQVLQQHPTSELSGNGRLSGTIPVRIDSKGFSVQAGALAAIAPGGQIQYRPENASAITASNKAMKLIVEALNDFHYSVLTSDVSYDNEGTLMLGLKISGKNPGFEGGRAINLNINLEEDIPALLTSLQLSSQISDKIKQRVQQSFLKKQGKTAPTGAKHERP